MLHFIYIFSTNISSEYFKHAALFSQISGSWFRASAITTTNKIQQDATHSTLKPVPTLPR
jgi:hypothetical protein